MAVPIVALALPYVVGAYHQEVGGQALEEALGEIDALNWWYVGPIAVQDSAELEAAIAHLEKATQYTHALRLLARAYAARGDLLSGIEALRQYTAQRPENAMGHLELAAAYERANEQLQEMYSVDLLEALPGAAVSAPDLPGETRYRAEGWHSEYAYPTAFLLPPDDEERPTLFLHAGSQVTYTLTLTQPVVLRFGMGLDPRSLDWGGDGVTFEVFANGARVFLEHLPVEVAREGWQERQVDLSAYAGQTIALSLASTPGPAGDLTADWAGWGEPRVEVPGATAYCQIVRRQPWRSEWAMAGVTAEDFVNAGEVARKAEQYDVALTWYERAMQLDADLGDPWYYVGLLHEDRQQWQQALDAYERAIELDSLRQVSRSSPHYRAGMIYQWRLVPAQSEEALEAFEAALAAKDFTSRAEEADSHFGRGYILYEKQADPKDYITSFQQAVVLNPQHGLAYLFLGTVLYEQDGDADAAQRALATAMELEPQSKWAPYHLGEIYRQEGRIDDAAAMYERALEIDPSFDDARQRLSTVKAGG
jgi:tetratricopeptide (TPR) repeat protein